MKKKQSVLKVLIVFSLIDISVGYAAVEDSVASNVYREVTDYFSVQEFETLKTFILEHGDRRAYCTMYNDNPHYSFSGVEAYLNPEIGQKNINCSTAISDFNEIVLVTTGAGRWYHYDIRIVRDGDLEDDSIQCSEWMAEGNVYLIIEAGTDMDSMESNIRNYLATIKEKLTVKVLLRSAHPAGSTVQHINLLVQMNSCDAPEITNEKERIRIFDVRGRVVQKKRSSGRNNHCRSETRMSNLSNGRYIGCFTDTRTIEVLTLPKH